MRLARIVGAVFSFAVLVLAQGTANHPGDDTAVRDLVQRYMSARESQDAKVVETLFTADADQLVSTGEWRTGRDAVVKGTLASSRNAGGKRTITLTSIRYVAPDAAVADGRYELAAQNGNAARDMWTSFVLVRDQDGWRITAIRNMLPAPMPSAAAK